MLNCENQKKERMSRESVTVESDLSGYLGIGLTVKEVKQKVIKKFFYCIWLEDCLRVSGVFH